MVEKTAVGVETMVGVEVRILAKVIEASQVKVMEVRLVRVVEVTTWKTMALEEETKKLSSVEESTFEVNVMIPLVVTRVEVEVGVTVSLVGMMLARKLCAEVALVRIVPAQLTRARKTVREGKNVTSMPKRMAA